MTAPRMEPSMDDWMEFCHQLTPYQNFALIGLLFLRPYPPLSILAASDIVTEENARAAEKWSESRLRQLLLFYCDKYQRRERQAAVALIDKADAIKTIVTLLVSTYAVPLGIAVAFLFWATGTVLEEWCQKYSKRAYNGKGKYKGNFPEQEIGGFFEVEYFPPITELVEDPAAYPLKVMRINLKVKAETDGRIKVASTQELNAIQFSFDYKHTHSFDFTDTRTNGRIFGEVDNVSYVGSDGPMVLRFKSTNADVEPS